MSPRHKPSCCKAKATLPTATRRSRLISSIFIALWEEVGRSRMWPMVQIAGRLRR